MRLTGTWPAVCALVALAGTTSLGAQAKPNAAPAPAAQKESDHREWARRVSFDATLTSTGFLVYPGTDGYDEGCGGRAMTSLMGVGSSDLFGLVWTRQSHCLGALEQDADGTWSIPVASGRFEVIDARGKTVTGQYRGKLVPTPNSGMGEVVPYGAWLLQGTACVSGGTRYAKIVDDCSNSRFSPIRGFVDLNSLQWTFFFKQSLGVAFGWFD